MFQLARIAPIPPAAVEEPQQDEKQQDGQQEGETKNIEGEEENFTALSNTLDPDAAAVDAEKAAAAATVAAVESKRVKSSRFGNVFSSSHKPKKESAHETWWIREDGSIDNTTTSSKKLPTSSEEPPPRPFYILNPFTQIRLAWDIFIVCLLIYNLFSIPFQLAFDPANYAYDYSTTTTTTTTTSDSMDGTDEEVEKLDSTFWSNLAIDIVFICDVVLNFLTATASVDKETSVITWITSPKQIAVNYLKSWFWFDIIGSIPIEAITLNLQDSHYTKALRVPRLFKFFRLLRLLRLARLGRLDRYITKIKSYVKINPGVLRLVRFLGVFSVLAHIITCLLFYVGTLEFQDDTATPEGDMHLTWITTFYIVPSLDSPGKIRIKDCSAPIQYLVTLYWAVTTMTTVGYGDIRPVTSAEVFMCIVTMLVGATVFSFIVGNMANLISRLDGRASTFRVKLDTINQFMHDHRLPKPLKDRVNDYMKYSFAHPAFSPQDEIMEDLSENIRIELAKQLYRDLILKVPLFRIADEAFINAVVLKLHPQQCSPGEMIIKSGEVCTALYFLMRGEVDILVPSRADPVATFFEGNFFGEHMLADDLESTRSPVTVVARSWSQLYILRRDEMMILLRRFPKIRAYIDKVSSRRMRKFGMVARAVGVMRAVTALKGLQKGKIFGAGAGGGGAETDRSHGGGDAGIILPNMRGDGDGEPGSAREPPTPADRLRMQPMLGVTAGSAFSISPPSSPSSYSRTMSPSLYNSIYLEEHATMDSLQKKVDLLTSAVTMLLTRLENDGSQSAMRTKSQSQQNLLQVLQSQAQSSALPPQPPAQLRPLPTAATEAWLSQAQHLFSEDEKSKGAAGVGDIDRNSNGYGNSNGHRSDNNSNNNNLKNSSSNSNLISYQSAAAAVADKK